ncbi:MAG: 7-cyano-7-deazaguanine synthase QueC [FCB group bacterium]|jgi:7-cyano-7-deazaguanine synthase
MAGSKGLAVVLISGGMDSALCTGIAEKEGYEIAGLHLNYGQKTQNRELKAFHDICEFYKIEKKLIVDVSHLSLIGGSSLTDSRIEVSKADLDNELIPTSYVPFRNANILSVATSWAEVIGASAIVIGAMQLDSSGYPDCRKEFFNAFQKVIELGTKPETKIDILTPLINFSKKDIVQKGTELNVPFHLTWSCYSESEIACGVCDSCALRLRGFQQAGIEDKIGYKVIPNYL